VSEEKNPAPASVLTKVRSVTMPILMRSDPWYFSILGWSGVMSASKNMSANHTQMVAVIPNMNALEDLPF
jgi:hypothetical protein